MYQIDFHKPLHIHFIGIGGISMSGLAEILLEENFKISVSDAKASPLTRTLEERSAVIYYGQRAANIKDDVDVVVYTAAIHPDNPEFACAKESGLSTFQILVCIQNLFDNIMNRRDILCMCCQRQMRRHFRSDVPTQTARNICHLLCCSEAF